MEVLLTHAVIQVLSRYCMFCFGTRNPTLIYCNCSAEKYKVMRRAAQAILTPQASARHLPIQQAESIQLVHDILETPEASRRNGNPFQHS
jgi:hypothetical protein